MNEKIWEILKEIVKTINCNYCDTDNKCYGMKGEGKDIDDCQLTKDIKSQFAEQSKRIEELEKDCTIFMDCLEFHNNKPPDHICGSHGFAEASGHCARCEYDKHKREKDTEIARLKESVIRGFESNEILKARLSELLSVAREIVEYKPDGRAGMWILIPDNLFAKLSSILEEEEK